MSNLAQADAVEHSYDNSRTINMGSIYGWLSTAETPSSPTWADSQRAASKCLTTATSKSSFIRHKICLLYTSPSPRDRQKSRMPSSA